MDDENKYIEGLIKKLHSPNATERYMACEELRVATAITPEAILALQEALNDPDAGVVDAARRALAIHITEVPIPLPPAPPMPGGSPISPEYILALEKRVVSLEAELHRLSGEVIETTAISDEAYELIPVSNIVSHKFLTRAFAIWGHHFVAQLIIIIVVYGIIFLLGLLAAYNH